MFGVKIQLKGSNIRGLFHLSKRKRNDEKRKKRNGTGITETFFHFENKHYAFSTSKQSLSSLIHFSILFFHVSMEPQEDSFGAACSFMVMANFISSTFPKWVPFTTSFSFGNTKKLQEARSSEYDGCSSSEMLFLPKYCRTLRAV